MILEISVPDKKSFSKPSLSNYDRLVIGYPFCPAYPDNPSYSHEAAAGALEEFGNDFDVVISLPVCPMEEEMEKVAAVLESAKNSGAKGVEVHSFGLLMWAKKSAPELDVQMGEFSDIYTAYDACLAYDMGASAGIPACEIDLEERIVIQKESPMELITVAAGIFPVAFSRYCHNNPDGIPARCTGLCKNGRTVTYGPDQKVLQAGRVIYSYRALDLLTMLPELVEKGFSIFRVNGMRMNEEQVSKTGQILRAVLSRHGSKPAKEELASMEALFPGGVCNGFYYGARGLDYIENII
ncbi:MAG: U32 family peptidase [Chloroflexi bacterium]|nr:U32 family peptidase [Chloroflexota bacterium]